MRNLYIVLIIGIILLLAVIVGLIFVNRRIINIYEKEIERLANGDMTLNFTNKFFGVNKFTKITKKLIKWIYRVLKAYTRIIDELKDVSESCKISMTTARQINDTFNKFDEHTKFAFVSVNKLTDISKNIYNSHVDLYSLSNNVGEIVDEAEKKLVFGNNTLDTTVKNLDEMNLETINLKNYMGNFSDIVDKVDDMAILISSLASSINLLSLNATIEAERAGESGKGFAIVAEEIRQLADKSVVYATDIKSNMNSINNNTKQVIEAINLLSKKHEEVQKSTELLKNSFNDINNKINGILKSTQDFCEKIQEGVNSNNEIKSVSNKVSEFFSEFMNELKIINEAIECQFEFEKLNVESCDKMDGAIKELNIITEEFETILNEKMVRHCNKIADMLGNMTMNNDTIKNYGLENGLSEINISDENGIIIYSSNSDILGYEYSKNEGKQSNIFRKVLEDRSKIIKENFEKRELDGKFYKYVAIARKDCSGIIQTGLDVEDILSLKI